MDFYEHPIQAAPAPRCELCGEVIGVYEPLIAIRDGQARETARSAEPEVADSASSCYHRTCYAPR